MSLYELDERQHATVLAALRAYKSDPFNPIASNECQLAPLTDDEISQLCESLNHGGVNKTIDDLIVKYGTWGEHPDYPRSDWAGEVDNNDTSTGYWEWVAAKVEEYEYEK